MNGAAALPMISLALWFYITIVNTVPCHAGLAGTTLVVAVSGWHVADVLPEVFGPQPAAAHSEPTRSPVLNIMASKLGCHEAIASEMTAFVTATVA